MKAGIWYNDWAGEPEFVQNGAAELVMIDGQQVATIHQEEKGQFRYSNAFGNLYRSSREACIVAGLQRDGYTVYG